MNYLASLLILSAFVAPILSQAEDYDACRGVFEACAAQGFTKDESAAPGMKIWLNCASPIVEHKKAVAKVDLDPNGAEAKLCRDYREAKQKFDADFAKKHQKKSK